MLEISVAVQNRFLRGMELQDARRLRDYLARMLHNAS
jgi:hypothetical protein